MTNKEFDEIMQQYVEATAGSTDNDLNKFRSPETRQEQKHKRNLNKKQLWFMAATMLVIVLVISITVPLTVNKNEPFEPVIYQITSNDIIDSNNGGVDQLEYYQSLFMPSIESLSNVTTLWLLKDNNKAIGAEQIISVYDENIENINVILLKKEYCYNTLKNYEQFANVCTWRKCLVKYETVIDMYGLQYNNFMFFEDGKYKYYISVITYEELNIIDLLDMIY